MCHNWWWFRPRPGPTTKIRLDKGMGVSLTNYLRGARSTFWNSAAMFERHTSWVLRTPYIGVLRCILDVTASPGFFILVRKRQDDRPGIPGTCFDCKRSTPYSFWYHDNWNVKHTEWIPRLTVAIRSESRLSPFWFKPFHPFHPDDCPGLMLLNTPDLRGTDLCGRNPIPRCLTGIQSNRVTQDI